MKISFYTTCMGRLHHLKRTLPHNLQIAKKHGIQVVIVNYSSEDDLAMWVAEHHTADLMAGHLKHVHVMGQTHFSQSHSKNIGVLCSDGQIAVNVDADNYVTEGYLAALADMKPNEVFQVLYDPDKKGCGGRVAMWREDILKLGGYDEMFAGWGLEDWNLIRRFMHIGGHRVRLSPSLVEVIEHDDAERMVNMAQQDLAESERANRRLCDQSIAEGRFVANPHGWGRAMASINFGDVSRIGKT